MELFLQRWILQFADYISKFHAGLSNNSLGTYAQSIHVNAEADARNVVSGRRTPPTSHLSEIYGYI